MTDSTAYGDTSTASGDWRTDLREAVAAHASEAERAEQFEAAWLAAQETRSRHARKVLEDVVGAACREVAAELRELGSSEVDITYGNSASTLTAEVTVVLASSATYRVVIRMDVSPGGDAVLVEALPEDGPAICSAELPSGWASLTLDEAATGIVDAYKAILDDDFQSRMTPMPW